MYIRTKSQSINGMCRKCPKNKITEYKWYVQKMYKRTKSEYKQYVQKMYKRRKSQSITGMCRKCTKEQNHRVQTVGGEKGRESEMTEE
jgi:hypothetical protein